MLDSKISEKALALVLRAKAYNAQHDVCWHGKPGGIQGYDTQYGLPVDCYGCESMDSGEPPYESAEIYQWALDTVRGVKTPRPIVEWEDYD